MGTLYILLLFWNRSIYRSSYRFIYLVVVHAKFCIALHCVMLWNVTFVNWPIFQFMEFCNQFLVKSSRCCESDCGTMFAADAWRCPADDDDSVCVCVKGWPSVYPTLRGKDNRKREATAHPIRMLHICTFSSWPARSETNDKTKHMQSSSVPPALKRTPRGLWQIV